MLNLLKTLTCAADFIKIDCQSSLPIYASPEKLRCEPETAIDRPGAPGRCPRAGISLPVPKRMRFTMREGSVMSWKPRKCVIALLTLATLTCFAALIAVNIKPQHDAYPSSLSIKMGQDFSLGRNVNYFNKLKPNEENILMFWASWCQHCESLIEDMQQLDNFAALRKNLFTVSEDSTIEEASVHEGDFPIYID